LDHYADPTSFFLNRGYEMTASTKFYDVVYAGNYTKDTIITPTEVRYVDGGAVNYSAHAAVRLGAKTAVVTRLAHEDQRMIDALTRAGVDCYPEYTPSSTLMTLEYKTSNVDQRTLSVKAIAGTISPDQMQEIQARAIVVGSSLRGEVGLEFFQQMRTRDGVMLALDVQGFVRVLRGEALVYEPWDEMQAVLGCVDVLKSDAVEAEFLTGESDVYRAARVYADLGPREIVLTHRDGVLIHANGQDFNYKFYPGSIVGRSGRGDTCIGTYVARRLSVNPQEAGRWAAAVTSMKLEKLGPFDRTLPEVEAFLQSHYAG
jgi:sugar/nucleoside kinase (ribokinase family)